MGVLGVSVGAGLAAVTLLTVPVFIPALQPRALQASLELLSFRSRRYPPSAGLKACVAHCRLWVLEQAGRLGLKQDGSRPKVTCCPSKIVLSSELYMLARATRRQAGYAGDEVAQRISQSGYDITPLTAQKKSELAELLTDHQR